MICRCQALAVFVLSFCLGTALDAELIAVAGRVTGPNGRTVQGVRIRLETYGDRYDRALRRLEGLSGSGETATETTPDASGLFRLDAPHAGIWRVLVEAPGYRTMEYRLSPLAEPRDLPALELEPAVAVEVRAVDAAGKPVPAAVALYDKRGGRDWRRRYQLVHTGGDGVARFEKGHAERAGFTALPLDAASNLALAKSDAAGGSIVLAEGVPGVLHVEDAEGAPVAGAVVFQGSGLLPQGVTDAEGRLAMARDRSDAEVWLLAKDGASRRLPVEFTEGEARVRLEPPDLRRGRVVEKASGEPIAGAFISPSYYRVTVSDARGEFQIAVPAIERQPSFTATAAGHAVVREMFEDEVSEPLVLRLPRAVSLHGTVVDAEGRAMAGCEVRATPLPEIDRSMVRPFLRRADGWWARTDGEGRFAVYGLAPTASYEVVAASEGHAPGREKVYALGPESPALRIVLGTPIRAFGQVVAEDGRPVAGAEVKLLRSPAGTVSLYPSSPSEARSFPTDAEGRFTAVDLEPGSYDIEVSAAGYAEAKVPGIEIPPADAGDETDLGTLVLERGAVIAGRVVDPDGHGVAGAAVRARSLQGSSRRDPALETAADGGFVLGDLQPEEERVVEVSLEGFAPSAVLATASREGGEPLRIVLRPPGKISGRVVDGDGRPIQGASVFPYPSGQSLLPYLPARDVETGDDGRFEADGLPAGPIELWIRAEGFQQEHLQGLRAPPGGELGGLEIALKTGATIRGTVTREDGTPVAVTVSATIEEGRRLWTTSTQSDDEGHYEIPPMAPALIRVSVPGKSAERTVDARQGGGFTVDLVVRSGFEVSGHVIDESGRGLAGALLTLYPVERRRTYPRQDAPSYSNAEGGFSLPEVQPGSYRLRAVKDGFATARSEEILQVAEGPVTGLRLVMRRGATLTGTVLGLGIDDLAKLSIEAHEEGSEARRGSIGHDGGYRIPDLAPGRLTLVANLEGRTLVEIVEVAEGDVEVHKDLDFSQVSTLRGKLVVTRPGEPPAPAPGVYIYAWGNRATSQGLTDSEGRFHLDDFGWQGPLRISVQFGLSSYFRQVEPAGTSELVLELDLARLRGTVFDAVTLAPLADVRPRLEPVPGAPSPWTGSPMDTTDALGRFDLAGIPTARWRLVVSKEGYAEQSLEVDLSSPVEIDGLQVLLQPTVP